MCLRVGLCSTKYIGEFICRNRIGALRHPRGELSGEPIAERGDEITYDSRRGRPGPGRRDVPVRVSYDSRRGRPGPGRRDRSGSAPAVRTTRQVLHSTGLEKGIRPHQLYRGKPSSSPGVRNGLILLIAFLFVFGEGLPS